MLWQILERKVKKKRGRPPILLMATVRKNKGGIADKMKCMSSGAEAMAGTGFQIIGKNRFQIQAIPS